MAASVPTSVVLPVRQQDRLVALALTSPAEEVCALLGGHRQQLRSVYPVTNVAARPEAEFLLEAEGQIAAMKAMRAAGEDMRGIFHSHPTGPSHPSAVDLAHAAYADVYYLIISLAEARPEIRAFYFDGRGFQPVAIRSR